MDGAFLFDYHTNEKFQSLTIFISEYHFGKLAAKNKIAELSYEEVESPTEGKIVLVPDFEEFEVKLIVADTSTKIFYDDSYSGKSRRKRILRKIRNTN